MSDAAMKSCWICTFEWGVQRMREDAIRQALALALFGWLL